MNGFLAALFMTSTLIETQGSLQGSFNKSETRPFITAGVSELHFQEEAVGKEIQLIYGREFRSGPLQHIIAVSRTDQAGNWGGYGFYNEIELVGPISLGFSFVPGVFDRNQEEDLGGWLMFRSGVEFEYDFSDVLSIAVSYDHRSSGDIWEYNPGLETIQLRFKYKLR